MRSLLAAALLMLLMTGTGIADESDDNLSWPTRSGYYRVSYTSMLEPLTINRIHNWVFHVEDADGVVVTDAAVSLTGGMPEHNHGLPTDPRMTKALGDGDYLLEGMRFHMRGACELTVTIDAGGRRDTVIISLTI